MANEKPFAASCATAVTKYPSLVASSMKGLSEERSHREVQSQRGLRVQSA